MPLAGRGWKGIEDEYRRSQEVVPVREPWADIEAALTKLRNVAGHL